MKSRFFLLAVFCFPVWSQIQGAPDAVVATVNGQKLTVRQFNELVNRADSTTKDLAQKQPEEFLRQLALLQLVTEGAEKANLDKVSPYKERLAEVRRQILFQAAVDEKNKELTPSDAQLKSVFEAKRAGSAEARVKVIFISLVSQTRALDGGKVVATSGPDQAKDKADVAAKRARAGEDFVTLAKEVSDDGSTSEKQADFPEAIRATSANIPPNMRDAILAAKPGDVIGPITHETGFYIFRVESNGSPEFAKVKDEIATELRSDAMKKWIEEMRNKAKVTVASPSLFGPK